MAISNKIWTQMFFLIACNYRVKSSTRSQRSNTELPPYRRKYLFSRKKESRKLSEICIIIFPRWEKKEKNGVERTPHLLHLSPVDWGNLGYWILCEWTLNNKLTAEGGRRICISLHKISIRMVHILPSFYSYMFLGSVYIHSIYFGI